jgi:hypothetical protein
VARRACAKVPQYMGMHAHKMGHPNLWGCILIYWDTPRVPRYMGVHPHIVGHPSIWECISIYSDTPSIWGCIPRYWDGRGLVQNCAVPCNADTPMCLWIPQFLRTPQLQHVFGCPQFDVFGESREFCKSDIVVPLIRMQAEGQNP